MTATSWSPELLDIDYKLRRLQPWCFAIIVARAREMGFSKDLANLDRCAVRWPVRSGCDMRTTLPHLGDIVVMDNLSSHKIAGVREAIEADENLLQRRRLARAAAPLDLDPHHF